MYGFSPLSVTAVEHYLSQQGVEHLLSGVGLAGLHCLLDCELHQWPFLSFLEHFSLSVVMLCPFWSDQLHELLVL